MGKACGKGGDTETGLGKEAKGQRKSLLEEGTSHTVIRGLERAVLTPKLQ